MCVVSQGAYLILCVLCSHIYGILHLESTTSEPLETLQPSRFKPPVTLPFQYSTKTLEAPQTLSEPPPVKGKCTCLVHVTHLLATLICLWTFWFLVTQECELTVLVRMLYVKDSCPFMSGIVYILYYLSICS